MTIVLVMAKAPVAGTVKTRLCPPATPHDAARIAAAALLDTLDAVRATAGVIPVLGFAGCLAEGEDAAGLTRALAGWTVLPQRGNGLGERLANAHADAAAAHPGHPVLQIGMDTPQVGADRLAEAASQLGSADAVLGAAVDGGWWSLGLRDPRHATVLRDVPMSTPDTGRLTRAALEGRGLRVAALPVLRDVDEWPDALAVAAALPGGRFGQEVGALRRTLVPSGRG
jgi:rSAM/selenodomain-associated transferase 1